MRRELFFWRGFLQPVYRPRVPQNLRFPAGEELAGKSHRWQGDLTAVGTMRSEGRGFWKENKVTERKHDY